MDCKGDSKEIEQLKKEFHEKTKTLLESLCPIDFLAQYLTKKDKKNDTSRKIQNAS